MALDRQYGLRGEMKKLRGGRRYYRALAAKAASFRVDLSETSWYDLWHTHFDWRGYGRRGRRHRRPHLAALFTAFGRALDQAKESQKPVQVFASIAPVAECEQDALYVHTPNPNGTPFPYRFDGVAWDAKAPDVVCRYLAGQHWRVGRIHSNDRVTWVIVPEEYAVAPQPARVRFNVRSAD